MNTLSNQIAIYASIYLTVCNIKRIGDQAASGLSCRLILDFYTE